ncbi:ornithine cyclodeaminase family protein [Litoreibacter roseus]|uniref:Ornithine cyclodeaminase n=1 Tax=Litoreibacter roseus TaxID=2601869 RepID=A0A6N6JGF5_9RHOB|nr:ornithine cyclodeaminase [Litoreibacter roseus]GFE64479.1 ornithine cyclodeaminase [Litoreibacter roseus]
MTVPVIGFDEGEALLTWEGLTKALAIGHDRPKAEIDDILLRRGGDTLLTRAAWIDGLGQAVKTATIFPDNTDVPTINGAVSLFSDSTGQLEAMIDFHLVTKWKTAGDSLLAAIRLARADSRNILIVGAGTVATSMISAYNTAFPGAVFTIWGRNAERGAAFADALGAQFDPDLEHAVGAADIICTATMSTDPLIDGHWLRPGQHLDLIGAYRPDMREVDDTALARATVYVDSFATTLDHIGELKIPLEGGAISRADIRADFYDLAQFRRTSDDEITICKNGGGAHLDLMTSRYILEAWNNR